jgi:HAE1 family hydrophobic/amphiphilic exporter-1
MGYPEVEAVFTNAGITSSGRIETNTSYLSEIFIRLNDKSKRDFTTSEFSRHIKNKILGTIPGIKVRPVEISIIGIRDDDAVQVSLQGINRDTLARPAQLVFKMLDSIPGSSEVQTSFEAGISGYEFKPDAARMEILGIDPLQAGLTLRTLVNGNTDYMLREGDRDQVINIISAEAYRTNIEDVGEYTVLNNQGKTIPFSQFGTLQQIKSKGTLERINRTPSVTIKSQVIGRPAGTVSNDLKSAIEKSGVSQKVDFLWGGASKRTTDALAVLGIGFAISIFLVYLVLVALYDSWFYPFAVLFSLPLAMTGALTAMALSAQALSIFSIMGLIMMTGLVGKNAILIVDFANILRRSGKQLEESVTEAVRLRLRPVLMTTLTIVIGLLPVALASGAGSEWKNGLAWALIGGLTSSLILTLLVIPVIYYSIEKLLIKMGWSELTRKKIKIDDYE